jgi:hypothetical protein
LEDVAGEKVLVYYGGRGQVMVGKARLWTSRKGSEFGGLAMAIVRSVLYSECDDMLGAHMRGCDVIALWCLVVRCRNPSL